MRKLTAISKHLQQVTGMQRERFFAFADQGTLLPTGRNLGNGVEVGVFKYDAVIHAPGKRIARGRKVRYS